ncbi:MAG: hypothetical protein R2873_34530 [Caldilineaceae bacterium]
MHALQSQRQPRHHIKPDGRQLRYSYNPDGTTAGMSITASGESTPLGLALQLYEWSTEQYWEADPAYRTTAVSIDQVGHLRQATFPDGSTRQFYYDQRGVSSPTRWMKRGCAQLHLRSIRAHLHPYGTAARSLQLHHRPDHGGTARSVNSPIPIRAIPC